MTLSPYDNKIYISNHGPRGGDFFGEVKIGENYGWKIIAWGGTNYDFTKIGDGSAWKPGFTKPIKAVAIIVKEPPSSIFPFNCCKWNTNIQGQ